MKKLTLKMTVLTLIALLASPAALAAESLSVLLQKGIYAEETEGNLDAAIKIYEGIVKDGEANRSLVAQAQYRLGVCELKRGKKDEAETAFRKIVERFSNETELLAKTRERLKELGSAGNSITVRQVWAPKTRADLEQSITSDGRYLSFTDWTTGDLAIRDLSTGQNRRLTDKGPIEQSSEFAETSVFSPDGKHVAYGWYPKRSNVELRVMALDNPNPRVLLTNAWVRPEAWSPDGKLIAALTDIHKRDSAITLVSVSDGSIRQLKALPFLQPDKLVFSPDGRYLTYSCSVEKTPGADIFLVEISSGATSTLIHHPSDDRLVGWEPDGRRLLFLSNRKGSMDLWAVEVQGTNVIGEPMLLRSEIGDVSILGITQSGALYYANSRLEVDLFRVDVDLALGKVISAPQQVPHAPSSGVFPAALAPNGRTLAYYSSRPGGWPELFVSDLETQQDRQIYAARSAQRPAPPRWLSDNKTLVHRATRDDGTTELALIETQSGRQILIENAAPDPKRLMEIATDGVSLAGILRDPDKKRFLLLRQDGNNGRESKNVLLNEREWKADYLFNFSGDLNALFYSVIPAEISEERPAVAIRRNLQTGEDTELMRWNKALGQFPSPDPSLIAVAGTTEENGRSVRLFKFTDGVPHEVWTTVVPGRIYSRILWTPDKRFLLCHRMIKKTAKVERQIWTISVETGQLRQLEPDLSNFVDLAGIQPDGKRLYFHGWNDSGSELWAMENFLPPVAAAK